MRTGHSRLTDQRVRRLADRHGADAPIRAAQRADELLAAGGIEGRTVWWQILAAVEELTGTRAPCQLN